MAGALSNSPLRHAAASEPTGLTSAEARARLLGEGPNSLPDPTHRSFASIVIDVLREPMLLLLLGAGGLYLALGDFTEGVILFAFAMLSVVITIVQEARTEHVLDALRALGSPRATVIRDGERRSVASAEVVRGDLLAIAEGERVAADGRLRAASDLLVDESLLTGESVPVRKAAANETAGIQTNTHGEDLPSVFSGSLVVRGSGLAEVTATGPRTAIGHIGQSLGGLEREPPRLKAETTRVVRVFTLAAVSVSSLTALLYGLQRADWFEAALAGLAIGMSLLPSELPVVLTVFTAMGAWRISKAGVLTRHAAAVESLGAATVLCTDKTGTLTENRMRVAELRLVSGEATSASRLAQARPAFADLLATAVLASARDATDPMERAFHDLARESATAASGVALVRAFGLRPDLLAVTHFWTVEDQPALDVATKGAPEAVADLCALNEAEREQIRRESDAMAERGLRVLGVARGRWPAHVPPGSPRGVTFEFLGLAGLADPVRADVPTAIRECRSAGIRVVMITGDYPTTALAVARQAGLDAHVAISGTELDAMDDETFSRAVAGASVFARVLPEQKLRIVQALKARGEIVAMTGDGVNDAPSLKAAHIGIAMGARGTDVAREAASMVLLEDSFASIVEAIGLGRRIYDNLKKAIGFIFAVHVPIAGLALLPLVAGMPLILGPVQIAFLQLIIDPVCSLVFEAEPAEKNVMNRPPRQTEARLFSRALVTWGFVQGLFALAVVTAAFFIANARAMPEPELRALCFFALVMSIVGLVFVNRSFGASLAGAIARPGIALVAVLLLVGAVLTATLRVRSVAELFRFGPLHADDLGIVLASATLMVLVLEALKLRPRGSAAAKSRRHRSMSRDA